MSTNMKNITTTLPIQMIGELDGLSKSLKIPKNEILINAFKFWQKETKKQELLKAYKRMADDNESHMFADMGIAEYKENLEKCEK